LIDISSNNKLPQRVIPPGSVNEYQRKLESKRAYHAMH